MKALWTSYRNTYAGLPRAAWLLAGAQLVNASGTMVVFFLTLYLTREIGLPLDRAGVVMSVYGLGLLAGNAAGGALSDRLGPSAVQRLSLVATAVLLVALGAMPSFASILATAAAWGFSNAMLFPANATAMAAVCPEAVRAKGFVLNRLANNLGVTIGPVVGGFLARHDYRLLFWVDAGTSLLAALLLWRLFPAHTGAAAAVAAPRPEPSPAPSRVVAGADWFLLALLSSTVGLSLVIAQVFGAFGPYIRNAIGFDEPLIGGLLAVNTILIVFVQMPLIHAAGRFSRTRVAGLGGVLFAVGFGLMPFSSSAAFIALTVAIWTFGEMLAFPSLMTAVSLRAPPGAQGRFQGLQGLAFGLGMTLGPALGTRIIETRGYAALWLAMAALALAVSVLLAALPAAEIRLAATGDPSDDTAATESSPGSVRRSAGP